jgi:predicted enzyme related to lactoylglutathione lyase
MDSKNGRFVWYELMTTDPKGAMEFYTDLIGWTTLAWGDPNGADTGGFPYSMWVGGQGPLGGVTQLPEAAQAMGAHSHWMCNVVVPDVDAAAAQVKAAGGQILQGPLDMPKVGRFAVVNDPQGALISLFLPESGMDPHDGSKHGEFCWNELMTSDHQAAFTLYQQLFGWERIDALDMGPLGEYLIFGKNGSALGGMFTKSADAASCWIYYINVPSIDAAIEKAKAKGATLINGPMDVPGGRIAQLTDPQGAVFALHTEAPKPAT